MYYLVTMEMILLRKHIVYEERLMLVFGRKQEAQLWQYDYPSVKSPEITL